MKLKNKLLISSLIIALIFSIVYITYKACFGLPIITVYNESNVILRNIKLSGTGYLKIIPEIAPGKSFSFVASAKGETGIIIDFESPKGGRIFQDDLAYIEERGGYGVSLTITSDFEIKTEYQMNKFSLKRIL